MSIRNACFRGLWSRAACLLPGLLCMLLLAGPGLLAGEEPLLPDAVLDTIRDAPTGNANRTQRLEELFVQAGAPAASIRRQPISRGSDEVNVWTVLPGTLEDEPTIVVGAHTDAMDGSPGVIDNWTSCVMLAALCGELRGLELRHTFLLIGFAGEEHGRCGSRAFLGGTGRPLRSRMRAMVNLECLGVGRLRSWANRSADDLEALLEASAAEAGMPVGSQVLFGYTADSVSFHRAGIPSMTIHSLPAPMLSVINTSADDGRHLDMDRYREAHRLLTAFLLRLDRHQAPLTLANRQAEYRPVRNSVLAQVRAVPPEAEAASSGVRLEQVLPDTPEFVAGLRPGDVVTAINGHAVTRVDEVRQVLNTLYRGHPVSVEVCRPVRPVNPHLLISPWGGPVEDGPLPEAPRFALANRPAAPETADDNGLLLVTVEY